MQHIITKQRLREFWEAHPEAEGQLKAWLKIARVASWEKFADVREIYASADQVGKYTVFNIGGNKFRLIVHIHFDRGKVYIHEVLTHADYDRGDWKDDRSIRLSGPRQDGRGKFLLSRVGVVHTDPVASERCAMLT